MTRRTLFERVLRQETGRMPRANVIHSPCARRLDRHY